MKTRTTFILLAVFLALSAYVYFGELRRPPVPGPANPTAALLWDVAPEQVVGLSVRSEGQETRLARPAGGEWSLEAPQADAADDSRVTQVLNRLASVTPSRTFTATIGPLEDYGLVQPSLEVALRLADGRTEALSVGASNPQQTAYYAQVQGQGALHLLPSSLVVSLRELLERPPVRPTPTPTSTSAPVPAPTAQPTATPPGQ